MQKVERLLDTFEDMMEVLKGISRNLNSRIYVQKEIIEAANEATMQELEKGTFRTPLLVADYSKNEQNPLLVSIITPEEEINFDVKSEPYGEYHLGLKFRLLYM